MKTQMVESHRERMRRIETGELAVVGKNVFTEAEPSPLQEGEDGGILRVDPAVERSSIDALERWRNDRDQAEVDAALDALRSAAADPTPTSCPSRWRPPELGRPPVSGRRPFAPCSGGTGSPTGVAEAAAAPSDDSLAALRERVERVSEAPGRRVKVLVGKPGLDGHSNGAEQIAVRARDAGMDVVYEGIRLTPARIARTAVDEGVHVVGLSILSGSHAQLIPEVLRELEEAGADVPVVVGGIIPRPTRPPCWRRACRVCTRPRTSRSAASWATSWSSWRRVTAWPPPSPNFSRNISDPIVLTRP